MAGAGRPVPRVRNGGRTRRGVPRAPTGTRTERIRSLRSRIWATTSGPAEAGGSDCHTCAPARPSAASKTRTATASW
jgi:hypothetical protein